jgi:hypothetical protein
MLAPLADDDVLQLGAAGTVVVGMRQGLPDHIDGIPVPDPIVFWQPRFYGNARPLPMVEVRADDDAPHAAASWPDPRPEHDLDEVTYA